MTATTGDHLLRAIAKNPDEDTPRLLYADWLEELPAVRVACPERCRSFYGRHVVPLEPGGRPADGLQTCPLCAGAGEVLDTSNADRAELIRVQVQLGPNYPEDRCHCGHSDCDRCPLQWRTAALQQNHPEWSRLKCPACRGKGGRFAKTDGGYDSEWVDCGTCEGTKDLLYGWSYLPPADIHHHVMPRPVTFARGFIDSVGCTLAEAFAPDGTPTPWARAVCEMLPLTRLVISDREPTRMGPGHFRWWHGTTPDGERHDHLPHVLPGAIYAFADGDFDTVAAATDALARAACRAVRAAGSTGAK